MTIGHTLFGNGQEKVLVLHGWFGDYAVWEPTFSALDTDTFAYAFMDNRGYGKSRHLPGHYTMAEIAADAIALVHHLGWDRFHVIGHSMGGMAMQRLILDLVSPERVKCAIGVDPVPACGGQLDAQTWPLLDGAITQDANRYKILDFTTGNRHAASWLNFMVARSRASTTEPAFAGYLHAWAKENFAAEAKGMATPMLICLGEHDLAFTPDAMQTTFLSGMPNAQLAMIANAGHYPMQETPVHLATLMQDFMRRHA